MNLSVDSSPRQSANLLIRFHNLLGAAVDVIGPDARAGWSCHGCGEDGPREGVFFARRSANAHAAECRAAFHHLR
ncbi:hypothetical protein [Streptomyces sp. NPDC048603]|uniref:hypothetical protein n=1 Tax=Streptomyces sp. NPDC048603 TaxID=3365577 RepID=UPI003715956A